MYVVDNSEIVLLRGKKFWHPNKIIGIIKHCHQAKELERNPDFEVLTKLKTAYP